MKSRPKPKKRHLVTTEERKIMNEKIAITGENMNVNHNDEDTIIEEKLVTKNEPVVGNKRSANMTMQLFLIGALMVILMTPMVVIIISLMTGFKDTVVTQAFSLFSNLAGIVVGGFLGRLTGENPMKKDEK